MSSRGQTLALAERVECVSREPVSHRGIGRLVGVDNVKTLRALLAAFNADELGEVSKLAHPDLTYTIRGDGPFAGTYHGIHDVVEVLQAIRTVTANTMTPQLEVVTTDHDHVMAYMRVTGSRPDGRKYDSHQAYLYRFADGLLLEGQTIPVDQKAFDGFTSD